MLNCSYELSEVIVEADGPSPCDELQYQKETSEYNRLGFCNACQLSLHQTGFWRNAYSTISDSDFTEISWSAPPSRCSEDEDND